MLKYYFPLFIFILSIPIILFAQPNVSAKTMYVIEINWVNVRSGPTMEYKIITRVKSGDALKILDQEEGWYYVLTPKGDEGWVVKSLLKEEKPLTEQLSILSKKAGKQSDLIASLTEENNSLKKYAQLSESNQSELKRLKNENLRLKNHQDLLWAGVGAGILFIGWIIGLITGSFYRKSKSKYHYSFK